ncbi:bifunctional rhamnulose-1-phosphate aldolase/short-chain dehydrogenase [Carboxydochorda subterranea]|uniref:Bifunctional rhamnulose-1-phosphate aldolase/short-chain dehydrogenase n=1 Tax=Carboxydichorda subterranea TaxID=3109565 RepID=A0ABZ1BXH5_9FIRM|nr:bifunctional rhamnulose-1-phosphate aldolase/short-chain dehydrogenase [Limnochorda sp. L945t]WRP16798.1 bifunctional rhamnulose-1-phosphate aldolase/short-chain dehydrogenase [Limnochorda sp. L945t]
MPVIASRWSDHETASLSDLELLVYRSRLLGAERAIVNWKGGNTSSKLPGTDVAGRPLTVLWVKGSGSDLATIREEAFTPLRLEDVLLLENRDAMSDEEMVEYLTRCVLLPGAPRPSIETIMHAFIPYPHVDHTHPDAVLAFCNTEDGERLAREAFGDRIAWVAYRRPGFSLAKEVLQAVRRGGDRLRGVFLARHGLVTWGRTHREAYDNTLAIVNDAYAFVRERAKAPVSFGGARIRAMDEAARRRLLGRLMPVARGVMSERRRVVLHYDDSPAVMEFAGSYEGRELSQVGSACPDHLVHTKHLPLWVEWDPGKETEEALLARLRSGLAEYKAAYQAYQARFRRPGDPDGDPYPRIVLIPGIGLIATGKEKAEARQAAGLYHRAIETMRGASALGRFVSLSPEQAYDVEYWPLELYKLTLAPPERELSRHVALITGAAGGIGRATADLLAAQGAHVVLTDIDEARLHEAASALRERHGPDRVLAEPADVSDEAAVRRVFEAATVAYGGMDVVVASAGLAYSAPVEETPLEEWERIFGVLARGYFLVAREAFRVMKAQGLGGSIVFITSKNALLAGKGAAAYNAAKAAEQHLARSLAEEGGAYGIRVNSVAPDAVLEGSHIWSSEWREARAAAYGIRPEELPEYYRQRTTLKVNVRPEDVAQAVLFLASARSSRTTGCTITVDGGVAGAYVR